MITIGLAIPCYRPHIAKLDALLASIDAQTRKPDQVVIHCSGSTDADVAHLERAWSFPLSIRTTLERRNAAQNRNAAVDALTTDVVSFVDADDTMHPQRLEIVSWVAEQTQAQLVFHGCVSPPNPAYFAPFTPIAPPWPFSVNQPGTKHPPGSRFTPVHGHLTVERSLAQRIRQPENLSFERREDSEFADRILALPGVRSAFIDLGLTKYVTAGSWEGAPAGSGEYALGGTASLAARIMSLPIISIARAPIQALWRGLPLSIRQRFLK